MASCNFCGASLADGTRFCSKCGAAITEAAAVGSPTPGTTATPAKKPSSGLKTILIVVGVIVVIGILGILSISLIAYRVARSSHYTQNGNDVQVETPFG